MSDQVFVVVVEEAPLFSLGQLLITQGVAQLIQEQGVELGPYVRRHHHGDWGDLCSEDRQLNNNALYNGSRLLSAYTLPNGEKIWIITDAEVMDGVRLVTTILKPEEY